MADPLQYQVQAVGYKGRGAGTPSFLGSLSGLGGFRTTLLEPPYMELARSARIFMGGINLVANGYVPSQDFITTAAPGGIYNAAQAGQGNRCIYPLLIAWFLASGTAAAGVSVQVGVSAAPLATPLTVNATGYKIQGSRGTGNSIAFGGSMTFPAGSAWVNVGGMESTADANPGQGGTSRLDGLFCVQPGYGFGVNFLSGAGTSAKFGFTLVWAECETDIET